MRIGNSRRRWTALKCRGFALPSRSGLVSTFAAATASWIARLMPTPPTGDIACAASPMQSRPLRYQRVSRFTCTVRSLTSSQAPISCMRLAANGISAPRCARNSASPRRLSSSIAPLAMTKAHCQYSPRFSITRMLPRSKRAMVSAGSAALRETRNHNASMGAPRSTRGSSARSRIVEWRPSAPTRAIEEELRCLRLHGQREGRETARFAGEEVEKVPLRNHGDERTTRAHAREVDEAHARLAELRFEKAHFLMWQLQESLEQTELV